MKYMVMGCNGMAGHVVSLYLKEQGHDVTGFARKESDIVKTVVGDAKNEGLIRKIISEGDYDCIVNCIGILNRFAEENKADAVYLNSFFPHYLVELTKKSKTQIIHISTDCVFSGKKGHYSDQDLRDGETFYDRSKALGELADDKNITIRTSIIGPDRNENGIGLLNWFMQQEIEVMGYSKAMWTGLTTLQLAKVIETMSQEDFAGLYNVVPNYSISKYELLKLFNKVLRNDSVNVESDSTHIIDKSLIPSEKVKKKIVIPDYKEMVQEMGEWMKAREMLYSHYDIS